MIQDGQNGGVSVPDRTADIAWFRDMVDNAEDDCELAALALIGLDMLRAPTQSGAD